MRSVGTHPHKLDHVIVELRPGAGTVGMLLDAHAENVRIGSDCSTSLIRAISSFNCSPMLMEATAQLYDFSSPIGCHGVECGNE